MCNMTGTVQASHVIFRRLTSLEWYWPESHIADCQAEWSVVRRKVGILANWSLGSRRVYLFTLNSKRRTRCCSALHFGRLKLGISRTLSVGDTTLAHGTSHFRLHGLPCSACLPDREFACKLIPPDCSVFALLQALPGQTTPEGVPSFKLVLVGDGGTGDQSCALPLPQAISWRPALRPPVLYLAYALLSHIVKT